MEYQLENTSEKESFQTSIFKSSLSSENKNKGNELNTPKITLVEIFRKMSGVSKKQAKIQLEKEEAEETQRIIEACNEIRKIETMKEREKSTLENKASKFMEAGLYDVYFTMMKNGYEPTGSQRYKIDCLIERILDNEEPTNEKKLIEINAFLEKGHVMSVEKRLAVLMSQPFQKEFWSKNLFDESIDYFNHKSDKDIHSEYESSYKMKEKYKPLLMQIREMLFLKETHILMARNFLNSSHYLQKEKNQEIIVKLLEFCSDLVLPQISLDQFLSFTQTAKKVNIVSVNIAIQKTLDDFYGREIQNIFTKSKEIYGNQYLEKKTIEKTKTLAKEYHIKNLPENAQAILQKIQNNIITLDSQKDILNEEQKFLLENLFQKRVPEVLQKYLSLDLEYRTTLTNAEGKNGQEIMVDTLNNFNSKLTEVLLEVNEKKLSSLSASKKYSQNI